MKQAPREPRANARTTGLATRQSPAPPMCPRLTERSHPTTSDATHGQIHGPRSAHHHSSKAPLPLRVAWRNCRHCEPAGVHSLQACAATARPRTTPPTACPTSQNHRRNIAKSSAKHRKIAGKTSPKHHHIIAKSSPKHSRNITKSWATHCQNITKSSANHRQNIG